jgi:hypothetical protein
MHIDGNFQTFVYTQDTDDGQANIRVYDCDDLNFYRKITIL